MTRGHGTARAGLTVPCVSRAPSSCRLAVLQIPLADHRLVVRDGLHRLASEMVQTAAGAQVASVGYGYNASGNVTSMTTSGLAAPGGGTGTVTNSYTYDEAGRLTGWNNGTAHTYGYDKAGNLTSNNGAPTPTTRGTS